MKHKNSIRPLKSPGKNSSGLTIWCGQCKRQIGQSCQGKNAAISSCDHLDKHKYKVVLRVPGQKQKKLTKNLETRNLDEARIQASILKMKIRENGNSKVEIERPKPQNTEKPLLLSEAIANYKAYLDNENVPIHLQVERSNEFIKDVKRGLDYLSQRMVNIGHNLQTFRVSDLNDHVVGDIYAGLKERGFSARTVNKYMGYYFSFLKYYSTHHIPTINYFGHGKREPLSPKPQSISKQEFDDLIRIMTYENGFRYYDGKKGERNFFRPYLPDAMYLLLETGRRREEVGKLKWTNVDEEEGVITTEDYKANRIKKLSGNKKKMIYIPLTPTLKSLLSRLGMEKYRGSDKYILAPESNVSRGRVFSDILTRGFSHYYAQLNTGKQLTLGSLRKTYITHLYKQMGPSARLITRHSSDAIMEGSYVNKKSIATNISFEGVYPQTKREDELKEVRNNNTQTPTQQPEI